MPHQNKIALSGTIQHVFAHRFVLEADGKAHLADLTPRGTAEFPIDTGLSVSIEGEVRPSEIKVTRISADGRDPVEIEHKKPHHAPGHRHPDVPADPARALLGVEAAGWTAIVDPQRKPRHFEILARREGEEASELHVDFAGAIYRTKVADPAKWGIEA